MEFGRAFTYPFEDPEWVKKLGIAGAIALVSFVLSFIVIGIAGFILLSGWMLEITRRVISRNPTPLPDWDDFGGYFTLGLKGAVVGLVYALPSILLSACINLLPLVLQDGGASDEMMSTITIATTCIGCLSAIYGIFLGIVLPAAYGRLAATGNIGAAFKFNEVFGLVRAAPAAYVIVLLGGLLASIIAGLGIIACGIGVAFTMAYATAINGHLYGQAYNVAGGTSNLSGANDIIGGAQAF